MQINTISFTGCGSGSARIGAMLTPYIAQVLLKSSLYSAVFVYAVIGILAGINAIFSPFETLGRTLTESGHEVTQGGQELVNENNENNELNQSNETNQ